MYHAGVSALGITALVGLLIGVVLSYLSSQQLARYGANVLIVDLLGISILRELGPLLAAILVAGRSGSAMTAQLGTMKLNQELDALSALGISPTLRLAWPKTVALLLVMPLLAAWTSALALLGGMLAANWELGLSFAQFLDRFPRAVKLVHLWVGLGKSAVFGLLIGLIGCHFGLTAPPSSEGLGRATTRAVVAAITLVIVADALFAVLFSITLKSRP
jgi:phospholipid/cholesterol/gamma-HCH transport system permease protein